MMIAPTGAVISMAMTLMANTSDAFEIKSFLLALRAITNAIGPIAACSSRIKHKIITQ